MSLTRFERARLIGARALQVSLGAPPLVPVEKAVDPMDIALREFERGILPLTVRRMLGVVH